MDDLCSAETIGGITHLIFASTNRKTHSQHNLERTVELRLLVPADRVDAMARAMLAGRVETDACDERAVLY